LCAMLVGLWQMDKEDLLAACCGFACCISVALFLSVIFLTLREVYLERD